MALGRIISADGNVTSFSYENTQNTLQINNSLTILGPNIIIEFAEGAENADLEAEYVNYLNKVPRNSSASLNTFMSHPIVSVFRVSTVTNSPSTSMTFDAASTLEEACALTTTRNGRISTATATIGSIVFEYYQVDGNVTVWDPINAGTYVMAGSGAKTFITVLEGGYVSSVEICPVDLTFENIAGASFQGPQYAGCAVALDKTFGLLGPLDDWPSEYYQLYVLDAGNYRPAVYDDVEFNIYMALEFNYDERQPVPGERFIVMVQNVGDAILVRSNEGQC